MRIAVPNTAGRVSPVFDWARAVVIREGDDLADQSEEIKSLEGILPPHRPRFLSELGVDVLLCGGISTELAAAFVPKGIEVVAGLAGGIEEVLAAYMTGRLPDPALTMPGWRFMPAPCSGVGQRGRCRRRNRGGRSKG